MPFCRKCDAEVKEDEKFCPACGTPIVPTLAERRGAEMRKRRQMSTKTIALIIIVAVAAIGVTAVSLSRFWPWIIPRGSIVGSGNLATEEEGLSDFTVVAVGWAFEVDITQSSSYSIKITADDNMFDYIKVSKTLNKLRIRLKAGYNYQFVTLRAEITMPELHELDLSGATRGTVEGFSSSHSLVLNLSGASSLDTVDVSAGDVEIDLSGASNLNGGLTGSGNAQFSVSGASSIELAGAANDLLLDASGASVVDLSDFPTHNVDVDLSGASRGTVNLDGRLDADLSGGSNLKYIGEPTLGNIQTSGGSTVEKE